MKNLNISAPILCILPALALIPVLNGVIADVHGGGLHVLYNFFFAALHPSLDPVVIQSAWRGLQTTIATALLAWIISMFLGLLLALLSSKVFWQSLGTGNWEASIIRRLLAIPRSVHELIWGLLLLQVFGINPWVAILAISIPYSSLVARVLGDQLDSLDIKTHIAITQVGGKTLSTITTSLLPPMIPIINSYGGYRLECALRGATILGIFGMGGIGTELYLTLQSLEFREMWTSLWMLGAVMVSLESFLIWWQKSSSTSHKTQQQFCISIGMMLTLFLISILWLEALDVHLISSMNLNPLTPPNFNEVKKAIFELPWINLISNTLLMTLLAAGIAIGTPTLGLLLFPTKLGTSIQSLVWAFLRLIPPPLSALLLLLCTSPSLSVAALALGLHSLGVMGRLLKEGGNHESSKRYTAIYSTGSGKRLAWFYGYLSPQSKRYLSYAAYRTDVLLRETAVVGVVGGVGLGWQLQESLSSFAWAQVALVTTTYITLTLIGETISEKTREYWLMPTKTSSTVLQRANSTLFV